MRFARLLTGEGKLVQKIRPALSSLAFFDIRPMEVPDRNNWLASVLLTPGVPSKT